ncbi:hypothetical protein LOC68_06810 [Blastopirellula sp. JC732]|uniref:Tetratricopeptide repeat protein n=1 Tax=Blastopirellula sediminis TaxID=2894196 RepID=A0A9X1MKV0_9BACT|nr:hypothetical protein [Blastopirellula sediminis]MCC9609123.1 hypothetical protein [Blastopirellula sediminis]MCC9628100.1 hypothetical protein [Blastopirellula sediminis]
MRALSLLLLAACCSIASAATTNVPASLDMGRALIAASAQAEAQTESNIPGETLDRFLELREQIANQRPHDWTEMPLADRAVWLFHAMHREILTGRFDAKASAISGVLSGGDYNCVSGTILYVALADSFALPVVPLQIEGHVWCRVAGEKRLDVESTCPQWFELSEEMRLGAPGVEAGSAAAPLSRKALVAKLYYNRAVDHLEQRQFAPAIELLDQTLALDPCDAAAEQNLLAAKNNWAVELAQQAKFEQAERLLQEVAEVAPGYGPLLANRRHIRILKVRANLAEGEYLGALQAAVLDDPQYQLQLRFEVYEAWLKSLVEAGQSTEAEQVLARAEVEFQDDWRSSVRLQRLLRSPAAT